MASIRATDQKKEVLFKQLQEEQKEFVNEGFFLFFVFFCFSRFWRLTF
jgi:hypothetical protein